MEWAIEQCGKSFKKVEILLFSYKCFLEQRHYERKFPLVLIMCKVERTKSRKFKLEIVKNLKH